MVMSPRRLPMSVSIAPKQRGRGAAQPLAGPELRVLLTEFRRRRRRRSDLRALGHLDDACCATSASIAAS
jgi:hypothetical protein